MNKTIFFYFENLRAFCIESAIISFFWGGKIGGGGKKIAARRYGFYLPSRENALAKTNTMLTNFESKSNLICQKNFTKRMTLKCYKNFGEREGERFIK